MCKCENITGIKRDETEQIGWLTGGENFVSNRN